MLRRVPFAILFVWIVLVIAAPWMDLHPDQIHLNRILAPPGAEAWLGFDDLGRRVWDRVVAGARTSFIVSFGVVVISAVLGTVIGTLAGYIGGVYDHIMVRVIDIFLAFPGILLAIALAGILGPGLNNVVIALTVVGWVGFARLARAQVLTLKHREHIQAARALGAAHVRIIARHLVPLILAPLIVEATFAVAGIIIAEAGLSFLGLGVQPPAASWGSMIRDGARYMLVAPHMVMVPGAAMMMVVLAVNLLGDRLRDRLDVRNLDFRKTGTAVEVER